MNLTIPIIYYEQAGHHNWKARNNLRKFFVVRIRLHTDEVTEGHVLLKTFSWTLPLHEIPERRQRNTFTAFFGDKTRSATSGIARNIVTRATRVFFVPRAYWPSHFVQLVVIEESLAPIIRAVNTQIVQTLTFARSWCGQDDVSFAQGFPYFLGRDESFAWVVLVCVRVNDDRLLSFSARDTRALLVFTRTDALFINRVGT